MNDPNNSHLNNEAEFTHLNEAGEARMVDVSGKQSTRRSKRVHHNLTGIFP